MFFKKKLRNCRKGEVELFVQRINKKYQSVFRSPPKCQCDQDKISIVIFQTFSTYLSRIIQKRPRARGRDSEGDRERMRETEENSSLLKIKNYVSACFDFFFFFDFFAFHHIDKSLEYSAFIIPITTFAKKLIQI